MSKDELLKYLIAEIDLIMHDKDYRFENKNGTWYSRESCRDLTNEEVFEELKGELRQLTDLETKLAESEENNKLLEMQLQDMERSKLSWENQYFTLYNTLKNYREVTEKKHLLDEKEWQDYCAFKHIEPQIKGCLDREREYEKQIAEKEKEIESYEHELEVYKQNDNIYARNMNRLTIRHNQDKISFAVEQLNQAKGKIKHNVLFLDCDDYVNVMEELDNQIKQLKEME